MSVLEVIEAVRSMAPPERERVRSVLDSLSDSNMTGEEAANAKLRAAGLLINTPTNPAARSRVTPVEIKGKPLSQTVIEERR